MAGLQFTKINSQGEELKKLFALGDNMTKEIDVSHIYFGAFVGETLIGYGSVGKKTDDVFEIYTLFVKENYRDNLIGTRLLEKLKNYAKENGAKEIVATVPFSTLKFFEKNGMPHDNVSFLRDSKRFINCRESFVFCGAEWVTFKDEKEAIIARKDFFVDEIKETFLTVSGLGYCDIYINGKSVSDRVLAPAWTNYVKANTAEMCYPIFDKMTYRILYEKIDVTSLLKKGENTIVFHIGGGWFCQHESLSEGTTPYGDITLCFKLSNCEKILAKSDATLKYRSSFVTRANIYFGEVHDARLGCYDFSDTSYCTSDWKNAKIIKAPLAQFNEQNCLPDKIIRKITPKCISSKGDCKIYDIGENISGYAVVRFIENTSTGAVCDIRYAENLNPDGSLNFDSAGWEGRIQRDRFTYCRGYEEYYPRFTWHAGRYFEVIGDVEVLEYRVIHTDLKQKITFKSSNETLSWIFDAFIRTQLSNTHGSIPSDCPHRERLGYTGDGQLTANAVMTCFDAEKMYRKWIRDIADSQDILNGHVQHTAPFFGGGGGPGGWGGAMVFVPYAFYKHFGDKGILDEYYENMLAYLSYMESRSENGLVVREELCGWCLGDWCSPGNKNLIPTPFVNTYFLIKAFNQVIEISEALGKDASDLKARCKNVKEAFLKEYYDESTGTFASSVESADAYGFDLGFGDERTLEKIVKKYEALGEFDTGIFGTDILIRVLCENGHKDLAFKLLTSEKENTFYNMKKHGATTLWENWNGEASHSHPMFGAVVQYIVKYFNEA